MAMIWWKTLSIEAMDAFYYKPEISNQISRGTPAVQISAEAKLSNVMDSIVKWHYQGLKYCCLDISVLQAFLPIALCSLETHMKNNHNHLWGSKSINVKRKLLTTSYLRKVYVFLTMAHVHIYIKEVVHIQPYLITASICWIIMTCLWWFAQKWSFSNYLREITFQKTRKTVRIEY